MDIGRVVALAAVRHGCEVGGIRLDHEPLERHGGDDLRRAARVLEGDRPVEREHPPQRQQLPRHLNRARKAVEHARHPRELANDGHRVGVGVAVVDDNREGQLLRKRHLAAQHVLLQLARGIFRPVVVQPDLADGDDLRPRGERAQIVNLRGGEVVAVFRVDANGGIDVRKARGKLHRRA